MYGTHKLQKPGNDAPLEYDNVHSMLIIEHLHNYLHFCIVNQKFKEHQPISLQYQQTLTRVPREEKANMHVAYLLSILLALLAAKLHRGRSFRFRGGGWFREAPEAVVAEAIHHVKGRVRNDGSREVNGLAGGKQLSGERGPPYLLGYRDADGRRLVGRWLRSEYGAVIRLGGVGRFGGGGGEGREERQRCGAAVVVEGFEAESLAAETVQERHFSFT